MYGGVDLSTLKVVIASTRPGRIGGSIGHWFAGLAAERGTFDAVEVLDLAELALPMFDEPHHPRTGQYVHDHTQEWSRAVDTSDALVFVSPEYNGFPPPSLLNAVDYLHAEWVAKPLGVVTYGGRSGGGRAGALLAQLGRNLGMQVAEFSFGVAQVGEQIRDGVFSPTQQDTSAGESLVHELAGLQTPSAQEPAAA